MEKKPTEENSISDDISDVKIFDVPVLIIFFLLFIIVVLQFFTRYVLNDSLGWTEEIARYFLILLGFVGGVTCVRKKSYIFLEFAYFYLPQGMVKPIRLFCDASVSFFSFYCGWLAIELANRTQSNMVSVQISKSTIYYIVSVGCLGMGVFAMVNFINSIKRVTP